MIEDFFSTIYYYTNDLYSVKLDNFLYNGTGYTRIGIVLLMTNFIASLLFYYLIKPVKKQTFKWFLVYGIFAVFNFAVALWFTKTPLINNEIVPNEEWDDVDCAFFGLTNDMWGFVFYVASALIIKWWSICKYIPFRWF